MHPDRSVDVAWARVIRFIMVRKMILVQKLREEVAKHCYPRKYGQVSTATLLGLILLGRLTSPILSKQMFQAAKKATV